MSQDPGQWENQTANRESQQSPYWAPEDKAELQREKEAKFERKWVEKERKRAEMKAKHHKATDQQQTSNQQQAWAHWEYTPEEWAQLDRLDWGSAVQRYLLTAGMGILSCLVLVGLFLLSIQVRTEVFTAIGIFAFILMFAMFCMLPLFLIPGKAYHKARKRHQARRNPSQSRTVTLSDQGIWEAGTYFPLNGVGVESREFKVRLFEVQLTSQPVVLHFRVVYDPRAYISTGGSITYGAYQPGRGETIHLLVPRDCENQAEHVAQRFRTEVFEPRERENARRRAEQEARAHPPEPI